MLDVQDKPKRKKVGKNVIEENQSTLSFSLGRYVNNHSFLSKKETKKKTFTCTTAVKVT